MIADVMKKDCDLYKETGILPKDIIFKFRCAIAEIKNLQDQIDRLEQELISMKMEQQ